MKTNIYTMQDWERDGDFRPSLGQIVSDEVYREMRDCVPPAWHSLGVLQVGEPWDMDAQDICKDLYTTFVLEQDGWHYVGHCLLGKTENRAGYCERYYRR